MSTTKTTPSVGFLMVPVVLIGFILISMLAYYSSNCKKPAATSHHKETTAAVEETTDSDNGYITVTGPNGDLVKVSDKFASLVNYITEDNTGNAAYANKAAGNEEAWKNKIKKWKEKMSNNTVAPSLTNFMDVVELSKVLNEN